MKWKIFDNGQLIGIKDILNDSWGTVTLAKELKLKDLRVKCSALGRMEAYFFGDLIWSRQIWRDRIDVFLVDQDEELKCEWCRGKALVKRTVESRWTRAGKKGEGQIVYECPTCRVATRVLFSWFVAKSSILWRYRIRTD